MSRAPRTAENAPRVPVARQATNPRAGDVHVKRECVLWTNSAARRPGIPHVPCSASMNVKDAITMRDVQKTSFPNF